MKKNQKIVVALSALAVATTAYATVIAQQTAPNVTAERVATDFATQQIVANNGVKDSKTGLIWKACLEGQTLANNGTSCTGKVSEITTLEQAKALEKDGWRLPTIKELTSITDHSKAFPAIDTSVLPFATGVTFDDTNSSSVAIWSNSNSPLTIDVIDWTTFETTKEPANFALSLYNGRVVPVIQNNGENDEFKIKAKYVLLVKDAQ